MADIVLLQKGPKDAKQHTLATSAPFDTLESIAKKNAIKDGWKTLALYLFGTKEADEVNRALKESVGVAKVDLAHAEKTEIKAMSGHSGKLAMPEDWTDNSFEAAKRYRLSIKKSSAPTAISITDLDKWFIPGLEANDIRFTVEGDPEAADKVDFAVFGSNYCECTDWNKGLAKYKILEDEPIFNEEDLKAPERGKNEVLSVTGADGKSAWKGQANTVKGTLSIKGTGEKERFINVAFSPYTVLFRYRKAATDKKAMLRLEPFWPQFKRQESTVAITPTYQPAEANPTSIQFAYTNADDADGGWLIVKDADGQLVWRRPLEKDELKKGARNVVWDGTYDKLALNGVMKPKLINDSAKTNEQIRKEGYLFRSWPYVFELKTYKGVYLAAAEGGNPDPSLIKWKLTEAKKIDRGNLQVFDGRGVIVWSQPIPKAKLGNDAVQEFKWDGKLNAGVKNSQKGDVAIEADMPYRVQIQVHTSEGVPEGLALAAMHTEVRLYVPQGQYGPKDARRSLVEAPQAMQVSSANAWARSKPPASGETDLYYQYALTNAGYYPGPLSGKDNPHLKRAICEFKRSVPLDVTAAAGSFKRHPLGSSVINNKTAEMTGCLGSPSLSPRWSRKMWGERSRVDANEHAPYPKKDKDVDEALADPKKDLILWVDDRQYYTNPGAPGATHGYGPEGVDLLGRVRPPTKALPTGDAAPSAATIASAKDWGLQDYRGGMSIGDTSVTHDNNHISQPWAPLKIELRLLGRGDPLYPEANDSFVKVDDAKRRTAMRRAIGPLRVDWSVHDALYDVSTIDASAYPVNPEPATGHGAIKEFRTRRFVAGALYAARRRHQRVDEALESQLWNCRKTNHEVGKVPDSMDKYHREVFGEGEDNSLRPWRAVHDDTEEATASILHDHIFKLKDEATASESEETLIESAIGTAGIWFNPAIAAGDGYRLRAEVKFKEVGDYKFPNLKALAGRYPVTPQAHTGEIRIWRRSTLRGYTKWSPATVASRWTDATINRIRHQYKMGHVYMTLDGADTLNALEFDLATLFNNFGASEQVTLRKFVKWHGADNWVADITQATAQKDYNWPWSHRADLGRPGYKAFNKAQFAQVKSQYMGQFDEPQWDRLTAAILYWINFKMEANGHMRGHMMVDFKDSPAIKVYTYYCATHNNAWLHARRATDGPLPPHANCPTCGAGHPLQVHTDNLDGIGLAAIGLAVGSSWLFPGDGDLWAHEIGHHKHLEHAASAGGRVAGQHDDGPNADVPGTAKPLWEATNANDRQWDRRCVMSYSNWDGGKRIFCGKCAMRNRGWKYAHVTSPADDVHEPA